MVRTALITGSSRGIGRAIADVLRERGVEVIAPTRAEMDLLSDESIDSYLASLSANVDILVNNAGINVIAPAADVEDESIHDTLQINLVGPMRLARGLIPGMVKRRYGRIVNISSIWSMVSKPGRLVYSAAKSGLDGMTRGLAVELASYNVLVNSVAPGYVNTELTRQNNSPDEINRIASTIPAGRLAEPAEIAELVAFICSEKNTYITGQTIIIDGGYTCM